MKSEEFFREVDQELKRDRLAALWRRHGSLLVALVALPVIAAVGFVGWQAWQGRQLEAAASRLAAADALLAAGKSREAAASFAAVAEEGGGRADLARLRQAQALQVAGDAAAAETALDTLSADADADPILKGLAALVAATRELDTAEPAQLRQRLEPLATGGAPWRFSARELLALIDLRTGDVEAARRRLAELDQEVGLPAAQQRRVTELLASLGGPPAPPATAGAS